MFRFALLALLVSFIGIDAYAQVVPNQILLLTGKTIGGQVVSRDSVYIYYTYNKKSGKRVDQKLDVERVFSYVDSNQQERIVYMMDTSVGNFFSEQEMRYFIQGEQDAMNNYHPHWVIWAGLPITIGVGYALSTTVVVFAVPFLYMIAANQPRPKIRSKHLSSSDLKSQPAYVLGFERAAQSKKLFRALAVGLIGTATAVAIGQSQLQ